MKAASHLKEFLDLHGSDKASLHNYYLLYGYFFTYFKSPPKILEIGLGSNDSRILSNMGPNGRPGESLRAFRDFSRE